MLNEIFCNWQGPSRSKRLTAVCSCYVRTYVCVSSMSLKKSRLQCDRKWCCNKGPVTMECTHVQQSGIYMHYCTYVRVYVCTYAYTYVYCFAFSHHAPGTSLLCCICCWEWCGRFPRVAKWRDYNLFVSRLCLQFLPSNLLCLRLFPTSSSAAFPNLLVCGYSQPPLPAAIPISVAKSYLKILDSCSTSCILVWVVDITTSTYMCTVN